MVTPRSKERQLLKTMKFPKEYEEKVNLKLIKWEAVKPWIAQRTTELLGMEDEVLISYIFEQLEGKEVPPPPARPSLPQPPLCAPAALYPTSSMSRHARVSYANPMLGLKAQY